MALLERGLSCKEAARLCDLLASTEELEAGRDGTHLGLDTMRERTNAIAEEMNIELVWLDDSSEPPSQPAFACIDFTNKDKREAIQELRVALHEMEAKKIMGKASVSGKDELYEFKVYLWTP